MVEEFADAAPGCLNGSFSGLAEQTFELGEDLLDGVEVGAIGWQEEQLGPGHAAGAAHRLAFVAAEIVYDDDVAFVQDRNEALFDIGKEALAVDGPIEDEGGRRSGRPARRPVTSGCASGRAAPWFAPARLLARAHGFAPC